MEARAGAIEAQLLAQGAKLDTLQATLDRVLALMAKGTRGGRP
jgi:hypothetical protein